MKNTTTDIYQVNDSFFHKIFDNPENARDFLERVLPAELKEQLDLENIKIEDTKYVSNQFKKGFSDIVVKTSLKTKKGKKKLVYIYFIIEHKTEGRIEIFIQVLKYMVFEWEKDSNNNKPPRVIIPVVFYHGADQWKIPMSFADQFDVDDELKRFLLDYRYVLFDTNNWDFRDESNKELKKNVFLFTSMVFMKAAYKNDTEAIMEIFNFWHERGFIENKDIVLFFLAYISHTHEISRDKLKKMLDDSKIGGGEIMPTLAQQFKEEFREEFREEFMQTLGSQLKDQGKEEGKEEGKREGKREGKEETAKELIKRGVDMDIIEAATGLSREELKKIASIAQ
jgi:predicted transposase/invertase (TIGR01784 family)